MDLQAVAKKEIEKIEKPIDSLKLINKKGSKIFELVKAYFHDAQYFYEKGQFLQAFEAAVICWAYIDAGLHLKAFTLPEEFEKLFTL